ncbi:MAG: TetR/AcrR family transcriptional regulator [Magnetovibrio sp.]|nr:TetR/AcrR family transcriptional regulator [Magnetovibrio sp.]
MTGANTKLPQKLQKRRDPHQARSREAVRRILRASADLLAEQGVDKLTTRRIAERANVNVSSLYQFFPNKHAIVYALYGEWIGSAQNIFEYADQSLLTATEWRPFFIEFLITLENVGFSAELETQLTLAMSVYEDLRQLDQDYLDWAIAKISGYIRHFAPNCSDDRLKAMAVILLDWDMTLANQEIVHKGSVHKHILNFTMEGLLHLLEVCIENKAAYGDK